jgi:oligoribonuclease NrnB/cAMP/cGMP phosphodiesterase (DHH superfamily)
MKCFYHNDLDGRCAGSIVAQYTNNYNPKDFYEVDYVMELPLDKVSDGEEVWFVDYSFKENTKWVLDKLLSMNCHIIWIDHHTSSVNLVKDHRELFFNDNLNIFIKDGISGAALTYMYCYNKSFNDIPYYVKLVSDYDCWQYKYEPDTTYFKIGIETIKFDALDGIWEDLFNFDKNIVNEILDNGKLIKAYIDNDNTYYREHFAYESEIAGHKCLVVNKKTNSWVFGEKYSEYPLVMVWVFDGNKFTYSIFSSNKDIDCSKIAESYGGGGHKGAAGFSSTELLFKKL